VNRGENRTRFVTELGLSTPAASTNVEVLSEVFIALQM
jgi:hypothetical protein